MYSSYSHHQNVKRTQLHFPAAFLALTCRVYHDGSLLERSPFPKKPRCQRIIASFSLVTHTERVARSSTPSHCGFSTRTPEMPKSPRTRCGETCPVFCGGTNSRGSGFLYMRLFSAFRAPALLLGPLCGVGAMRDMVDRSHWQKNP